MTTSSGAIYYTKNAGMNWSAQVWLLDFTEYLVILSRQRTNITRVFPNWRSICGRLRLIIVRSSRNIGIDADESSIFLFILLRFSFWRKHAKRSRRQWMPPSTAFHPAELVVQAISPGLSSGQPGKGFWKNLNAACWFSFPWRMVAVKNFGGVDVLIFGQYCSP